MFVGNLGNNFSKELQKRIFKRTNLLISMSKEKRKSYTGSETELPQNR